MRSMVEGKIMLKNIAPKPATGTLRTARKLRRAMTPPEGRL